MKITKWLIVFAFALGLVFFLLTRIWFISDGPIAVGSDLKKSDWLSFWGSYLSFIGTSALGCLSLWQNNQLHRINKNLTEQNAISEFFSDIVPKKLEIRRQKFDSPLGILLPDVTQVLVRKENSLEEYFELLFFRLEFLSNRPFKPQEYKIERIHFNIITEGKTENVINGYCNKPDVNNFFYIANRTLNDCLVMPVFLKFIDGDEKPWDRICKSGKVSINLVFRYKNSQRIITYSEIVMKFKNSNNSSTELSKFRIFDHIIFKSSYSYDSEFKTIGG